MVKRDILQKLCGSRDPVHDSCAETCDATIFTTLNDRDHGLVVDAVRSRPGDDARVLDAGAGRGFTHVGAMDAGALDLSAGMIVKHERLDLFRDAPRPLTGGCRRAWVSEPCEPMPGGMPELRHRTWLFRVMSGRAAA